MVYRKYEGRYSLPYEEETSQFEVRLKIIAGTGLDIPAQCPGDLANLIKDVRDSFNYLTTLVWTV
jgi:hypothetical protein